VVAPVAEGHRLPTRAPRDPAVLVSAMVLEGLSNADTGAMAAAATTSLPEVEGGSRNWDYRFSWIRDSTLAARALAELGFDEAADAFRRFIQRSSAGHVDELQIAYGVGGERRLREYELDLAGFRGSSPVRVGNAAAVQRQNDVLGELALLAWRWHRRGHSPDDDTWRFICDLADAAVARWDEPDAGIWELRDRPDHFVHSKVMRWAALDRAIALAEEGMRRGPVRRWARERDRIARVVERRGYDRKRRTFRRAFGSDDVDGALLLLPHTGFVDVSDERMAGAVAAIMEDMDDGGLLRRYKAARPRGASWRARSGWSNAWPGWDGSRMPRRPSSGRRRPRTTSASSRRSTTPAASRCSATSPRRSRTSPTSPQRRSSPATRGAASGSASTTALAKPCGRGRRPERVNGSWRRLHVSFAVPRHCRHPSSPACDTLPRLTHRCGAPTHNAEAGSSQRI
jgi:hypothetical protein